MKQTSLLLFLMFLSFCAGMHVHGEYFTPRVPTCNEAAVTTAPTPHPSASVSSKPPVRFF